MISFPLINEDDGAKRGECSFSPVFGCIRNIHTLVELVSKGLILLSEHGCINMGKYSQETVREASTCAHYPSVSELCSFVFSLLVGLVPRPV